MSIQFLHQLDFFNIFTVASWHQELTSVLVLVYSNPTALIWRPPDELDYYIDKMTPEYRMVFKQVTTGDAIDPPYAALRSHYFARAIEKARIQIRRV